ncbi:MAG: AAA family ATPase [Gammaproteobacteria bacterium]|nr:AAA family ATPase [Gammaproteobacteria bacterium]MCP5136680.1 AAA family ATPase [Gammaproteobacteria bacterium]
MSLRLGESVLARQPFDNTRDPRCFYASSGHAEAISRLQFMIEDRNMGLGMLTGEIGCGKTISRTVLQNKLSPEQYTVVSIENGMLNFDELLLEILSQIRRERVVSGDYPDRYSRLSAFKQTLMRRVVEAGRHLVILIDEAQSLHSSDIEAIKSLTNISSERRNFITVILIGQPELRQMVKALPPVDQRISLRYHLNPLSPRETLHYIAHRMRSAGLEGPIPISREAVALLAEVSGGIPREINRLGKLALEHAIANDQPVIRSSSVRIVAKDLVRQGGLNDPSLMAD